ncbi:MAG: TraR/DksA C4-type zinc finger protein [bacterium]
MSNLDQYRQRLLQEKERLVRLIEGLEEGLRESQGDSLQELSTYDNHPADVGSETYERSKDLGLRDNNRLLLAKVEEALQRIEAGTYGRCEICGQEIAPERLQAVPYTTLCLDCKREQEERPGHSLRPREEEALAVPFSRTFLDDRESVVFDGEDSWQAVARYNKQPHVYYEDIGEDEDTIGQVEKTDAISNEDYKEQL